MFMTLLINPDSKLYFPKLKRASTSIKSGLDAILQKANVKYFFNVFNFTLEDTDKPVNEDSSL